MKVLIDECLPRFLKRALIGHEAETVQEAGWSGVKNGELLVLAESRFEVFLTADQNLRYQQNLARRTVAIIELPANTLSVVKTLVPQVLHELSLIKQGDYKRVERPV